MSRHYSDDSLASFVGDALKPRKAARIGAHLVQCPSCQRRIDTLKAVPSLLANVAFPPMPERMASRIETALASEASARLATEPATEAGRRDLPSRSRAGRRRPRIDLTSPLVLRTVAATGAAVIVAGGTYEIVAHVGSSPSSTSGSSAISPPSHGPVNSGASGGRVTYGPGVSYDHKGHTAAITAVRSSTDYRAATLAGQASSVIAAQHQLKTSPQANSAAPSATNQPFSPNTSTGTPAGLDACVNRVATGRTVLLVDIARYDGKPATIIVTALSASQAEVFAVGSGCSASASDILAQQSLSR
jgi:hypothetical protein